MIEGGADAEAPLPLQLRDVLGQAGEPLGPFVTELDNMLLQVGGDENVQPFSPTGIDAFSPMA
jgi:hypothetical protein